MEKKKLVLKESTEMVLYGITIILTVIALACGICYVIAGSCNEYLALGCLVICFVLSCILDRYGRTNK